MMDSDAVFRLGDAWRARQRDGRMLCERKRRKRLGCAGRLCEKGVCRQGLFDGRKLDAEGDRRFAEDAVQAATDLYSDTSTAECAIRDESISPGW